MRTLAVTQNMTLDGSIEMLDDWFDPAGQADASDQLEVLRAQYARNDALVVGRQTFTDLRGYWPALTDDPTGVAAHLNGVAKYVVSSTLTDPGWENTRIVDDEPVAAVRALKEEPGDDVVVTGSITLTHALLTAGLVDELRLFTFPYVQGRGRRLVPDGHALGLLHRREQQTFRSGVTFTRYELGVGARGGDS